MKPAITVTSLVAMLVSGLAAVPSWAQGEAPMDRDFSERISVLAIEIPVRPE